MRIVTLDEQELSCLLSACWKQVRRTSLLSCSLTCNKSDYALYSYLLEEAAFICLSCSNSAYLEGPQLHILTRLCTMEELIAAVNHHTSQLNAIWRSTHIA